MLKIFLVAVITTAISVQAENRSKEEMMKKVVLPDVPNHGLKSVKMKDCLDKDLYRNAENLKNIHNEDGYLCAFIAFQANKEDDSVIGVYRNKKDATMRYELFKTCVKEVNAINSKPDNTWSAGVNLFCDMTKEEQYPYSHGLRRPQNPEDSNDVEPPVLGSPRF